MREDARYVNHLGKSVELNSFGARVSSGELSDWSISFSSLNGRAASFHRGQRTFAVECVVIGATDLAGMEKRDELYETAIVDIEAESPGRLYVGEWYMEGYIVESTKDRYWITGRAADYSMAFCADDPRWTREHVYSFRSASGGGELNYPHNYPHNYAAPSSVGSIDIPSVLPSPARITIYGPAENPMVSIGGTRYEVGASVPPNGILVVDGIAKTIKIVTEYGSEINAFHLRRGTQRKGSGSFVFERIPAGASVVSWDGSFGFDLAVFEKRDERRWR